MQCAFSIGAWSVMRKAGKVLWDHFVSKSPDTSHTSQIPNQGDQSGTNSAVNQDEQTLPYFTLDKVAISSSSSSRLKHFIFTILSTTHFAIKEEGLVVDQLPHHHWSNNKGGSDSGCLRPQHLRRLRLVQRLLVAVEVAGMLNEEDLCVQVAVQVCGLLVPLLQLRLSGDLMQEVLLHCLSVLMEVPESLLIKSLAVASALHQLVAAIAYNIGKVLIPWEWCVCVVCVYIDARETDGWMEK